MHTLLFHNISFVLNLLSHNDTATQNLLTLDRINQIIVGLERQLDENHRLAAQHFLFFYDDRQRNTSLNDYTITNTPTVDVAGFAIDDLPPSHHHDHPLLLPCRLPPLLQLDIVVNRFSLTPDLYPQFPLHQLYLPLSFHRSPLVPDGFTPGITLKQMPPTAFIVSRQSQRNSDGGLPFSL